MELVGINIRSWRYSGGSALEDMVLGMEENAVRDQVNQLSTEEFDACIGIVVCRMGPNSFGHLGQIVGYYRGDPESIWDLSQGDGPPPGQTYEMKVLSRIHRLPDEVSGPLGDDGVAPDHRAAVLHYLLDMG